MPHAAPSRCHCGAKATRQGRCDQHQRKPWENASRNSQRLTGAQRNKIRADQLTREPQCRGCGTEHNLEADHIVEIADGGAIDDPQNLMTLCKDCHQTKTQHARQARRQRKQAGR